MADPQGGWTLVALCAAAGVSRSVGRTAIRHGLLRPEGWQDRDVPVLTAAANLLGLYCPFGPEAAAARNVRAVAELKAALADGQVGRDTVLLVGAAASKLADGDPDRLARALAGFSNGQAVTVIPVGRAAAEAGVVAG